MSKFFPCPHCGSYSTVRTSQRMSDLTVQARYRCSNDFCGYVFQVMSTVTGYYVPSALPNPAVLVPRLKGSRSHQEEPASTATPPLPTKPRPFRAIEELKQAQAGATETTAEQEGA
ncbi:ogr/Delta-like zinc finger family protein [Aeromonas media]|uniref:ogr/Delta-like zinc finger family protein n=1 Tax=Aeromonas media TaxID=651 RepID=UPI003D24A4C3